MDLAFSTPITSLKIGHCKWVSSRMTRHYREGTVYLPLRGCYWPTGASGKEPACQCWRCKRCVFDPWVVRIPWRRKWQPLRYSCLENPMDRGAWQGIQSMGLQRVRHNWAHTHSINLVLNVLVLFLDLIVDDRDIFNSFTIYPIIKALAIN